MHFARVVRTGRGRRGFTLVEVAIGSVIFTFLMVIVCGGLILFAKSAKSTLSQQRLAEKSRRFLEDINFEAADAFPPSKASSIPLISADGNSLTLTHFDGTGTQVSTVVYKYVQDASAPVLTDNSGTGAPAHPSFEKNFMTKQITTTTGPGPVEDVLAYCSKVKDTKGVDQPVFVDNTTSQSATYFNINVHTGDRDNLPNAVDNAFTGPGYQGYRISATVALAATNTAQ